MTFMKYILDSTFFTQGRYGRGATGTNLNSNYNNAVRNMQIQPRSNKFFLGAR